MNDQSLLIAMSRVKDGSMSKGVSDAERLSNRTTFLAQYDISAEQTVLVQLRYEGDDYCRYQTVSADVGGEGMTRLSDRIADALFTRDPNVALFLPVADCIGAVIYDASNQVLGLAHLGRHNLVQHGATKVIEYMGRTFATDPNDVIVWMSPAAGKASYPMHDFNGRSLHEVAIEQFEAAGVSVTSIEIDPIDTTTDDTLFSHSEFLKGNRLVDGRQAVVAVMRP